MYKLLSPKGYPYLSPNSFDHAELQTSGSAGFVQQAQLVPAEAFDHLVEGGLGGAFTQWLAIEEPPAPAAAA